MTAITRGVMEKVVSVIGLMDARPLEEEEAIEVTVQESSQPGPGSGDINARAGPRSRHGHGDPGLSRSLPHAATSLRAFPGSRENEDSD